MRPEIKWRLWIKDSERFCLNPLKDEVTIGLVVSLFLLGLLVCLIHIVRSLM